MPIVSRPTPDLTPRDEVISDLGMMIDEAAASPEEIDPWALALAIVEFMEGKINSVDQDGQVIYRT